MRIRYNAPVTLTFTLVCLAILLMDLFAHTSFTATIFSIPGKGSFDFANPFHYIRLFTHAMGHMSFAHFIGNFSFILLLGPILEEKYNSFTLLFMMAITALVTGLLNVLVFPTGLLGASGIVFMMILLASFTNIGHGDIPLTFLLVLAIYLSSEISNSFDKSNVSSFAHLAGGICGSLFGFIKPRVTRRLPAKAAKGDTPKGI
ncbi:MAG: rhomboid family intramembrane serine protease [Spirochaetaceae bacterium]|nr:rhomboid family intramembrane serine protease [Spirochaetaceae bacterium]